MACAVTSLVVAILSSLSEDRICIVYDMMRGVDWSYEWHITLSMSSQNEPVYLNCMSSSELPFSMVAAYHSSRYNHIPMTFIAYPISPLRATQKRNQVRAEGPASTMKQETSKPTDTKIKIRYAPRRCNREKRQTENQTGREREKKRKDQLTFRVPLQLNADVLTTSTKDCSNTRPKLDQGHRSLLGRIRAG